MSQEGLGIMLQGRVTRFQSPCRLQGGNPRRNRDERAGQCTSVRDIATLTIGTGVGRCAEEEMLRTGRNEE